MKHEYQRYLQSAAWWVTRDRRMAVAGHRCEFRPSVGDWNPKIGYRLGERCTETSRLQVHHLHYRTLGNEHDNDLEVLCRFHHLVRHASGVECAFCCEWIEIDDEDAIASVKEAIEEVGGRIDAVSLDSIRPEDVCPHCQDILDD